VDRTYDIFEKYPDGSSRWLAVVTGRDALLERLNDLSSTTTNELFAIYMPTKEIIATRNAKTVAKTA